MGKLKMSQIQLDQLTEKWRDDVNTAKQMLEEINYLKSRINETKTLNEGVLDVIQNYLRKGVLSVVVLAALLASNQVNAQQLKQAGVPEQNIERAIAINNSDKNPNLTDNQIDNAIIKNLKKAGFDGTIASYKNLPAPQKTKIIDFVRQQVQNGKDLKTVTIKISDYVKGMSGKNKMEIDQKVVGKKITVDTILVEMKLPLKSYFPFNGYEIENSAQLKKMLQDTLNTFLKVDSIVINASASTLRNKHEAEGLTWMELSDLRAKSISSLLDGMKYSLGGKNVNPIYQINSGIIKTNIKGENGDGTSGPPSPYETDPAMIANYKSRGIDPKFWDSNSKGNPLGDLKEYEQYQWVNVMIYGKMVETETNEIVNFRYVSLMLDQTHKGNLKKIQDTEKNVDVTSCPIH